MEKDYQYVMRWAKILKAIEYLGNKCTKCGETDPILLDFHHNDVTNKKEDVSRILGAWVFKECISELDRCSLLCTKCHRKEHFNYDRFNKLLPDIKERMLFVHEIESRRKKYDNIKVDVLNLLLEHKSFRYIERETGMCRKAIKNIALDNGIDRSNFTNRIDIDENLFIELYNSGISYSKMSKKLNISLFPLQRIRKKLIIEGKIKMRRGKPPKIIRVLR